MPLPSYVEIAMLEERSPLLKPVPGKGLWVGGLQPGVMLEPRLGALPLLVGGSRETPSWLGSACLALGHLRG